MQSMKTMNPIENCALEWRLPAGVRAASSTRSGGISEGNWATLNLAGHVGDDPAHFETNRQRLVRALSLPAEPVWLNQVHGRRVALLTGGEVGIEADASFTRTPGVVCGVMTADCLPVLFVDRRGGAVAAAHAGWRGLASGVLEETVGFFEWPDDVRAWLGPAIGPAAFEVGDEVREAFVSQAPADARAFSPHGRGHWMADIYTLARSRLERMGLRDIQGGGFCTFRESRRFFSYRRESITGRMASLIWIDEEMADE